MSDYENFVDGNGVDDITHVVDADGSIWSSFSVASQPAWAFVDADGTLVSTVNGALGADGLRDRVNSLF